MNPICYLCGQEIVNEIPSGDHVVPKQFIKRNQPKVKGFDYGGKIPTHAKCNNRFGPERMCLRALQLLGIDYQKYVNSKNPEIGIQTFKKEELNSFSKEDFEFFGLIDTTNFTFENWAHNPDFFKDKKPVNALERASNIARSVLTKSAAALLVKDYNVSPKSEWNILCMSYKLQKATDDFDSIFGKTKPFDADIKTFDTGIQTLTKKYKNGDLAVWYKYEKILLIIVFAFSEDKTVLKDYVKTFREAEKFLFESPKLMDLVNYNWSKNAL